MDKDKANEIADKLLATGRFDLVLYVGKEVFRCYETSGKREDVLVRVVERGTVYIYRYNEELTLEG